MQRTTTIDYYGKPAKLTADATLHAIGEQRPYFSLTGDVQERGHRDISEGGCIHERILATWPDLADVAALHLSDIDGVPMHAEANGWYFLAAYLGVKRTHRNRTNRHGNRLPDVQEYTGDDSPDPLGVFASHIRVTEDEASRLASRIVRATVRGLDDPDALYAAWARECESMRPRWKAEADAAIAHHGLTVTR